MSTILGSDYNIEGGGQTPQASKLVSGVPLPQLPQWSDDWTLKDYHNEMNAFITSLFDYLRRLSNSVISEVHYDPGGTGSGGGNTLNGVTDWQLNPDTNKFQVKVNGMWLDCGGIQPILQGQIQLDTSYDTSSHVLSKNTFSNVLILHNAGTETDGTVVDTAEECTT